MPFDEQQLESRIDRVVTGEMEVSHTVGGVGLRTFNELFEFSKAMATSKIAVPKHCRGEPGVCMALCVQAFEWRMSPFAVANKSYSVNDRLAYESQLVHAVVEARAPLEKRLRETYKGEGPTRRCTVSGTLKGDATPFEYTSPMLQDIKVKNSPLWTSDPDQQLFYYSTRAWARRYVPDVLLGIYTEDELAQEPGPATAVDITPASSELAQRIAAGGRGKGFDPDNIDRALALEHKPGEVLDVTPKREAETVAVSGQVSEQPAKKRSHHKKKEAAHDQQPGTPAADDSGGAGETSAVVAEDQSDAGERVETGEPVGGTEGNGTAVADTPGESTPGPSTPADGIDEEPEETTAQAYAREFLEKIEAHLKAGEIKDLDTLKAYKATTRQSIDGLQGLSGDDMDVIRGRFTTIMLEAERALAKKKGGKR